MSTCDCLECAFRRADREAHMDRDDLRLRTAMTALSRVMYWVWLSLTWGRLEACGGAHMAYAAYSGYFRLVYA